MEEVRIATIINGWLYAGPAASSGKWVVLSLDIGELRTGDLIRFRRDEIPGGIPSPALNATTQDMVLPRFLRWDVERDEALAWMAGPAPAQMAREWRTLPSPGTGGASCAVTIPSMSVIRP